MSVAVSHDGFPGIITQSSTQFSPSTPLRTISDLYTRSASSNPPLRIGLLLDTAELPGTFATVLGDIVRSNFARVELAVYNASSQPAAVPAAPRSTFTRITNLLRSPYALWGAYARLDDRLWRVEDDPLAMRDCAAMLEGIESFKVEPLTRGFVHRFPPEAIERIRAGNLDVLIRFGFNIIRGDILTSARYGVWSFHHGDNDEYRGGPAHFWEMCEKNPMSGVILQVLTDELDGGRVLGKALFATEPGMSLIRNRVRPHWGSTHLMIQKLWELHNHGWEFLETRTCPSAPYRGKRKVYRRPVNREVAGWMLREAAGRTLNRARRAVTRAGDVVYWQIALRAGADLLSSGGTADMRGFNWLSQPRGHYYADPFVFEHGGQPWLFFEDYSFGAGRGTIGCAEISPSGTLGPVRTALDTGSHLSFPYVFAEGDDIYMIPESAGSDTVRLYRCAQFPDRWVHVADLFNGAARDTAVWKQDGLWWFFTTLVEPRGQGFGLYLFYADELTGTWHYHPANPISFDARRARCAGRLFEHGGRLIRPSQDARWRYGYAFGLNEIVTLTPEDYEERPLLTVEPDWSPGLRGCHTYNRAGAIEVTDGQTVRRRDDV